MTARLGLGYAGAVSERFRALALAGDLDLPLPGAGHTWRRWQRLAEITASEVSLGRLAEGHADALAILAEAGAPAPSRALLGVWAAEGPESSVEATPVGTGLALRGRRAYCSGARVLTHALLAVRIEGRRGLVLLDLDSRGLSWEPDSWPAIGMAGTDSLTLDLEDVRVAADRVIGGADFYVDRPGFWMGAMGVAACWWGGARGVLEDGRRVLAGPSADRYRLARWGTMYAALQATGALFEAAAHRCDEQPGPGVLRLVALTLRSQAAHVCGEVLEGGRTVLGSAALCHDAAVGRRVADLHVYVSQFREGAELADLGAAALNRAPGP